MGWWNFGRQSSREREGRQDEHWNVFVEVLQAHSEWERAHLMFDEARGQDQIDYAIYILEAAERKYQIHLKHAKTLGLNRAQL
ncbi:hypothetical protein [Paenibacillus sp. sgz5001063]|uniref:hypothetical protein n=1 Tax=Paenibacillus sp. sgz5001063 TaxID=3242474 RepID=UPI0036D36F0C